MLSGGLLLALLAIAVLYFYNQHEMEQAALQTAERSAVVDQQISSLGQDVTGLNQDVAVTSEAVVDASEQLQTQLDELNQKVAQEVTALNEQIRGMDDQVQSLDGRLDYTSPFSAFGSNSVIHGAHWLQQLPAGNYVVELAVVNDRQELYDVASRYSHYLKDELAYYAAGTEANPRYVLTYGNYADLGQARSAMRRLPSSINFRRPLVRQVGEVLQSSGA
jgi:septal ring-binding cell division protein DamX